MNRAIGSKCIAAAVLGLGLTLSACSSARPVVPPTAAGLSLSTSRADASRFRGILFFSDSLNVLLMPTDDLRQGVRAPIAQLKGVSYPVQMAIDGAGTVYVANAVTDLGGAGEITEYPRGATVPIHVLTDGLSDTTGIAVDSDGDVYASNKYLGSIVKFAKGQRQPSATITANLIGPDGLAVDRAGDLFIADGSAKDVLEMVKGSTTPESLHLQGLFEPIGIAVDSRGNLYVSNMLGPASRINVYAPGARRASRSFVVPGPTVSVETLGEPAMLSIAPGDIMIASAPVSLTDDGKNEWTGGPSAVDAFMPGTSQPTWVLEAPYPAYDAVFQPAKP